MSVDDEVAAELIGILGEFNELLLCEVGEVAVFGTHHDGDLSQGHGKCVGVAVDLSGDLCEQRRGVGFPAHSALLRVYLLHECGRVV